MWSIQSNGHRLSRYEVRRADAVIDEDAVRLVEVRPLERRPDGQQRVGIESVFADHRPMPARHPSTRLLHRKSSTIDLDVVEAFVVPQTDSPETRGENSRHEDVFEPEQGRRVLGKRGHPFYGRRSHRVRRTGSVTRVDVAGEDGRRREPFRLADAHRTRAFDDVSEDEFAGLSSPLCRRRNVFFVVCAGSVDCGSDLRQAAT